MYWLQKFFLLLAFLAMLLVGFRNIFAQEAVSGSLPESRADLVCADQLLAAQQHLTIVVRRRDRDEQTIAELVIRIQRLQQEVEGLKKNVQKTPNAS